MDNKRKEYLRKYWKEHRGAHREAQKRYVEKIGKEEYNEYQNEHKKTSSYYKEWYEKNKEKKLDYSKQYKNTPLGRAHNLLAAYRKSDKKYNRREGDLTAKWIVENIFTKKCQYCGETDWHKLGCDRIDNTLPHTKENVVPCCFKCNCKKH